MGGPIEYPDSAPGMVSRAFQEMLSGRRDRVTGMPWDVFTQRAEVGPAKGVRSLPGAATRPGSHQGGRGANQGQQKSDDFCRQRRH